MEIAVVIVVGVVLAMFLGMSALIVWKLATLLESAMDRQHGLVQKFADQSLAFSDTDLDKLRIHVDVLREDGKPKSEPRVPRFTRQEVRDEIEVPAMDNPIA